jgi:hypothetical protein
MALRKPTLGNHLPVGDGDLNLYRTPLLERTRYFNSHRRAIYVNGIDNLPADHRQSALALSTFQACKVVGVYNATQGKLFDVVQCISDIATFTPIWWADFFRTFFTVPLPMGMTLDAISQIVDRVLGTHGQQRMEDFSFDVAEAVFNKYYQIARNIGDLLKVKVSKHHLMEGLLRFPHCNRATLSLYHYLRSSDYGAKTALLFAHSQGNLIVGNALIALALAEGRDAVRGRAVYSFGSPCRRWPPGILHRSYAFTNDWVTLLDGVVSNPGEVRGSFTHPLFSHDFREYLRSFSCSSPTLSPKYRSVCVR